MTGARWLGPLRLRLASSDANLHFALIGVASGILTGLLILLYRQALENLPALWMPGGDAENFEDLPLLWAMALPAVGGIALGLIMSRLPREAQQTGVAHVVATLHQGAPRFRLVNLLLQAFGSMVALLSGQSGGREGPAVHIGAAASALSGRKLGLPDNALRILAACGTAAAIAASFNTPIAGVIFAMEVVLLEYTVAGFLPVILAAVSATAVTQSVYGGGSLLGQPEAQMASLWELSAVFVLGVFAGSLSAAMAYIQKYTQRWSSRPVLLRMTAAGLLTAACVGLAPAVAGMGYDTIQDAFAGNIAISALLLLIALKVIATAVSCGMGMPLGVIGPSLLIGALVGSLLGSALHSVVPGASGPAFYALMGMGACMGALMNAPLAALLAVMELTHNPQVVLPAMLCIVVAQLIHRDLFRQFSSPQITLLGAGIALRIDPLSQLLRSRSAISNIDRNVQVVEPLANATLGSSLEDLKSRWVIIEDTQQQLFAFESEMLLQLPEEQLQKPIAEWLADKSPIPELDLLGTLQDGLDIMIQHNCKAVLVRDDLGTSPYAEPGILSRKAIETLYMRN